MICIKHLFHIQAPSEKVYSALTTIEGLSNWWTIQISGDATVEGTIVFRFGQGGPDMKVIALIPGKSVIWQCIAGPEDWIDTTFTFSLDTNENKTRVRFEHAGWKEANDSDASCNFSWGRYLESLRQYCQTGIGEAFGSETYRR